jgi:hypothetical protein
MRFKMDPSHGREYVVVEDLDQTGNGDMIL